MTELTTQGELPRDMKTGLTLPLSKYLGSQELGKHRAMVAVELEVMAKKLDRFGWERDRGTMAHDRLLSDWMDALQDYTLDEVKAACVDWVRESPRKMPNEGDILKLIMATRKRRAIPQQRTTEESGERVTAEAASDILAKAGFAPKGFDDKRVSS